MINVFLLSNQHNDYLENKFAYDLIFDSEFKHCAKKKEFQDADWLQKLAFLPVTFRSWKRERNVPQ